MNALAINWKMAAEPVRDLESSLNQLALRQRAIMLVIEGRLSGGPLILDKEAAESLYSLVCEQGEAISQLNDSYYTAHNSQG